MAFRNDGGNFSNEDILRLIAQKQGSMSENELAQHEAIPQDAINMASGVMGTVGRVPIPEMGMQEKIRQAVANSSVKGPVGGIIGRAPGPLTGAERLKNFGEVITPEGGVTEGASMYQKGTQSGDAIAQRFKQLRAAMGSK